MSEEIDIARKYFEVSNKSDMKAIALMMSQSTTYSSANTGLYLGVDQIVAMQENYHALFKKLHWTVVEINQTKPGIVLVDFIFDGEKLDGEVMKIYGQEYIIIYDGKIQHIDIRNK